MEKHNYNSRVEKSTHNIDKAQKSKQKISSILLTPPK